MKKYLPLITTTLMIVFVIYTIVNFLSKPRENSFEDMLSLESLSQYEENIHDSAVVTYGNKTYEANYFAETGPDGVRRIMIFAKEIPFKDMPKEN